MAKKEKEPKVQKWRLVTLIIHMIVYYAATKMHVVKKNCWQEKMLKIEDGKEASQKTKFRMGNKLCIFNVLAFALL